MSFSVPKGLVAPILTPFNDDLSVATDLYVGHALDLIDKGCVALAPFGTTGEALSVGIEERVAALDALIAAGVDPKQLIPGTGLTNLPDTLRLTNHALDSGCRAVMTLPPFYIKDAHDDGLFAYYERLISSVGPDALKLILYHIPQVAGVGLSIELVARLRREFPDNVVGIKDSSGDWSNTRQLFDIDGLTVWPGSELPLVEALELGAPGCISATANVNTEQIVAVISAHRDGDEKRTLQVHSSVSEYRRALQGFGLIAAQKHLLAESTGDPRWRNVRPPLLNLPRVAGRSLDATMASLR